MTTNTAPMRIGELLIKAGLLKAVDLEEAIQVAGETGLPVGRVLIMSGYVTEPTLKGALEIQSLIKEGALNNELAVKGLYIAAQKKIGVSEALQELGWSNPGKMPSSKLGDLLLDAQIISQQVLSDALRCSSDTGLPLGRILVASGFIPEQLLSAALSAQVLIRDGKVTREQALKGLALAGKRKVTIEQSLLDQGYYKLPAKQTIKLGELLVLAGMLTESDLMNVLELGLVNQQPLGQVLIGSGFLTKILLETALKLQEMVSQGKLTPLHASEALRQVHTKGINLGQAIAELGLVKSEPNQTVRLGEMLCLAGFINADDIKKAVELSAKNSALIGKMLLVTGLIDESTLHAALRCQFLVREGFLKMEQAIIALNYCQRTQASFDDAMHDLGWSNVGQKPRQEPTTSQVEPVSS